MYLSPAYEITCPSCGQFLRGKVRQAALLVCKSCKSVILDPHGTPVLNSAPAVIPLAHPFIAIGTQGKVNKSSFEITGRIHYTYNDGFMNDWHIVTEERKSFWLSESFGHYALFNPTPEPETVITDTHFEPDENSLTLNGQTLVYEGSDSCTGFSFEGELPINPFAISYPFLSLNYSNSQILACAHVFSQTDHKIYSGIRMSLEQLSLTSPNR